MTPDHWVTLILGIAGGGGGASLLRLIFELRDGRDARHRAEVDRAAAVAAEERNARIAAEDRAREALAAVQADLEMAERAEEARAKRERMALEAFSYARRVAFDHGAPPELFAALDFGGR